MPIGFVRAQLQPQRKFPKGHVSFLLTGIEGSTEPTLTETGYVGLAVHAAARICYATHGGQIVVSSAAAAGLHDSLADGVRLRSLGGWRFQGLREPEELFQVDAPDLLATFPPPRAADRD